MAHFDSSSEPSPMCSSALVVRMWDSADLGDSFSFPSRGSATPAGPGPELELPVSSHPSTNEESPLSQTDSLLLQTDSLLLQTDSLLQQMDCRLLGEMAGGQPAKWHQPAEDRRLISSSANGEPGAEPHGNRENGQMRQKLRTFLPAAGVAASLVGLVLLLIGWRSSSETLLEAEVLGTDGLPEGGWLLHTRGFVAGAANGTCGSLQERHLYYPKSSLVPAPALLQALREYESMHRRCVTRVRDWRGHFAHLEIDLEDCKYLIWKEPGGGVGDRFVSMVAAFEYALLTNRALLVSTSLRIQELLCSPLEGSSLWLPDAFPMEDLDAAPHQGDYMARMAGTDKDKDFQRKDIVAVTLQHWISGPDFVFFCSQFQEAVKSVPWMSWEANQYVGPDLFLVPEFERRLLELFPDRAVTSHTVRFLLHPVNKVWNRIATVYRAYFNFATKRVGLEVNTFQEEYDAVVTQRILDCAIGHNILPAAVAKDNQKAQLTRMDVHDSIPLTTVFVASSISGYFQDLKKVYTEQPTSDRSVVGVHSESTEGDEGHPMTDDEKTMVDIWLLSLTDDLLISFQSTCGYIANALHGQKPAFYLNIRKDDWNYNNQPTCLRAWSSNLCYHTPPLDLRCSYGDHDQVHDGKSILPYHRPCQDSPRGVVVVPVL